MTVSQILNSYINSENAFWVSGEQEKLRGFDSLGYLSLSHSFTLSHWYLEHIVKLNFYISAYIIGEISIFFHFSANLMLPFECSCIVKFWKFQNFENFKNFENFENFYTLS